MVRICGIPVDNLTAREAVREIVTLALSGAGGYISTPNVDHIVRARRDPAFLRSVLGARLRVPDGMGIVYGARILGTPLRETVTGRLLPEAVARATAEGRPRVALFGGPPGAAEAAARRLARRGANVVEAFGPSMRFVIGSDEDEAALERIRRAEPDLLWVGFGAPKQELWMNRHAPDLPKTLMVGVGAAIPVLGGASPEAPRWMTRVGLEWLFRLAVEPRRLGRRYLRDDPRFFWWVLRQRMSQHSNRR